MKKKMPTLTYKHIYNSHKPTRKPKIAKELVSFPPGQNYFLKFPSLQKILKRNRTAHDRQHRNPTMTEKLSWNTITNGHRININN